MSESDSAPGRRCVFCGQAGALTAEHILAKWIWRGPEGAQRVANIRPVDGDFSSYRESFLFVGGEVVGSLALPRGHRWVHPPRRTVRIVCRDCNSGWMSSLEAQFKQVMSGKLGRASWRLTVDELAVIRRWVMKTGIMHEFTDGETRLVDQPILDAIREGVEPPGTWYLGIARATAELDEGLDSCPVLARLQTEDTGRPVLEVVYAMQHLITFLGWIFVLRYTPCPVVPPARLDHDLARYPGGAPLMLTRSRPLNLVRRRELPRWGLADVENSDLWLHALDPRRGTLLMCGEDRVLRVALAGTSTEADLGGYQHALGRADEGRVWRVGELQERILTERR